MRRRTLALSIGAGLFLAATGALAANPAVIELQTNLGTIAVRPDYANAPISAANFLAYVNSGFYQDTLIHRAVKGFVIQGGGYSRIDGLPKATFAPIVNESTNGLSNLAGTIAMARTSDPNSATSQFFINLVNNTSLDYISPTSPGYAVFGKVVKGMPVARKIEALASISSVPFSPAAQVVSIDAVYANTFWNKNVARTRITVRGQGTVTSDPAGISCGADCIVSQTPGAALKLTAIPAAKNAFTGWQGDCQGPRRIINLDTTKGNHNCTAVFTRQGPSLQ